MEGHNALRCVLPSVVLDLAPFVDSLLMALEKRGFTVWLDYHTLVPGQPWQEQIETALVDAEAVLLVVSQESIESKHVEWEWQKAIALQKRIILIIFEAVKLPPELQQCEWIDLRGRFRQGIKELTKQLETSAKLTSAPPQKGYKVSLAIGIAIGISSIVSLLSLLTIWTGYIPYYLFPLPYRILKRDFNFFHVRNALIMLPFASFWTYGLATDWTGVTILEGTAFDVTIVGLVLSILFTPLLLIYLYLPAMQRWGKPIASRPKFANPFNPKISHPQPTRFTVDFAQEDKKYADAIIHCLKRYGHTHVEKEKLEAQTPEAILVLISAFKSTTPFSPEEDIIYPILLQDTRKLDPVLQRIQWIDFRRGLKNLDKLAQLLSEPTRLLKALGIAPMSNQTVLPLIVQVILSYLTILVLLMVGSWSIMFVKVRQALSPSEFIFTIISLAVVLTITIATIQSLINRKGRWASLSSLLLVVVLFGLVQIILFIVVGELEPEDEKLSGVVAYFACLFTYLGGLLLIVPLGVWHGGALRRWFPHRRGRMKTAQRTLQNGDRTDIKSR
jgi:TIR domain